MGCNVDDCSRISSLLDSLTDQMKTGFDSVKSQLSDIKDTQRSQEERLRKVELSLASYKGENAKVVSFREWTVVLFGGMSLIIGLGSLVISWVRGGA